MSSHLITFSLRVFRRHLANWLKFNSFLNEESKELNKFDTVSSNVPLSKADSSLVSLLDP